MLPTANIARFPRSVRRRLCGVLVAAGLTISGTSAASANVGSGADIAVGLGAVGAVFLLPGARYTVSITNNGPEPLSSATVIVRVDPRSYITTTQPCPFDAPTTTFTCSFGSLPVGAKASLSTFVYLTIPEQRATFEATATRTASTPQDPNSANDSDPATCWYQRPQPMQFWPPPTHCTLT